MSKKNQLPSPPQTIMIDQFLNLLLIVESL